MSKFIHKNKRLNKKIRRFRLYKAR